jgi:RNA polymerase sigma-70 factor (ECF subfamily)
LSEAQDVMQETSVALWARFDEYDQSRPFGPWAYRFAYFEALRHRKTKSRSKLVITDAVLELLSDEYPGQEKRLESARYALRDCVGKLPDHHQKLVHDRYGKELSVKEIAAIDAKPAITIYKALERVRKTLFTCIKLNLAAEA